MPRLTSYMVIFLLVCIPFFLGGCGETDEYTLNYGDMVEFERISSTGAKIYHGDLRTIKYFFLDSDKDKKVLKLRKSFYADYSKISTNGIRKFERMEGAEDKVTDIIIPWEEITQL